MVSNISNPGCLTACNVVLYKNIKLLFDKPEMPYCMLCSISVLYEFKSAVMFVILVLFTEGCLTFVPDQDGEETTQSENKSSGKLTDNIDEIILSA